MCRLNGLGGATGYAHHTAGFLLFALFWSGAGDSSNPELARAELPADIVADCPVPATERRTPCSDASYRIAWMNRRPLGEPFLVQRDACGSDGCRAWIVLRDANAQTRTLLSATGEIHLQYEVPYPVVQTRLELAGAYTSYNRFEWNGERYVRAATRLVYGADGVECADERACQAAAQEALRRNQSGRAVRIWEQVHGVSWI